MLRIFLNSKNYNYFKSPFKYLDINNLKKLSYDISYMYTTSWFENGNGKNVTFNII